MFYDKEIGVGTISLKNTILIVVTSVTFIVLLGSAILEKSFKINKYIIILGIYLALIVLSALKTEYPINAWFGINGRYEGAITLACYFIIFYLFYKGFKYNKIIFCFVTIALLIVSCFGIVQALLNTGKYQYMASSNFTNPNMFSSLLALFMPIYLVKYFSDKDHYIYICGIIFAAIVCTKTFGGYFTFIIYFTILSIYFICISKNRKKIVNKVLKILFVILVIFIFLNLCNDFVYLDEIGINLSNSKLIINGKNIENTDSSATIDTELLAKEEDVEPFGNYRLFIWKLCFDVISKYPMFGVGPDSLGDYVIYNHLNKEDYILENVVVDKAHNEYLHVAVTTGIPSALVYICFLFMIVISLILKYKKYVENGEILESKTMMLVAVSASIGSYLIQAFGNISIFAVAPLFWAMLGIGAKLSEDENI